MSTAEKRGSVWPCMHYSQSTVEPTVFAAPSPFFSRHSAFSRNKRSSRQISASAFHQQPPPQPHRCTPLTPPPLQPIRCNLRPPLHTHSTQANITRRRRTLVDNFLHRPPKYPTIVTVLDVHKADKILGHCYCLLPNHIPIRFLGYITHKASRLSLAAGVSTAAHPSASIATLNRPVIDQLPSFWPGSILGDSNYSPTTYDGRL